VLTKHDPLGDNYSTKHCGIGYCATFAVSVYAEAIHTAVHEGLVLLWILLSLLLDLGKRAVKTAGDASICYSRIKPKPTWHLICRYL